MGATSFPAAVHARRRPYGPTSPPPEDLNDLSSPPWSAAAATPAALWTPALPVSPTLGLPDAAVLGMAATALAAACFFAVLRSALLHSVPRRVLAVGPGRRDAASDVRRDRLAPLLERAEPLATSASVFEITAQILFVAFVFDLSSAAAGHPLLLAIAVSAPLLVFASQVLPGALRGDRSDALLRAVLPGFELAQKPLAAVLYGLEAARRALLRVLGIRERPRSARRIVEGLRDVIEESDLHGELSETERELIENVIEFHDVGVVELMTPRTELQAVEVDQGLEEVMRTIARTGHVRIPVYERSLDSVLGLVHAEDVIRRLGEGPRTGPLRPLLRPVAFVPETKRVSELLREFRRDGQKLAVVIDEYGGTAGLITLDDILTGILGDVGGGFDRELTPIRSLADGSAEVRASAHVSDVNEELDLRLPEQEDYGTLAGFVLAEFGRLPRRGESFVKDDVEFLVTEASDRRVLTVRVRRLQPH